MTNSLSKRVIASMDRTQAKQQQFAWPQPFMLLDNLRQVVEARDYLMIIAFINSVILTVCSVAALVVFSSMVAYVWQRRPSRLNPIINILVLGGLIVPPAVVPTIWVLQKLGLFKTMPGLIFFEIAFGLPFCILRGRGKPTPGVLPSYLPGTPLGRHDRDHLAVCVYLQRLPEPAVLPAGHRERHSSANPVQLQEPVHNLVQPAFREHSAGRDSGIDHVHLLHPKIVEGMAAGSVKG
jgi:hypothetical protein